MKAAKEITMKTLMILAVVLISSSAWASGEDLKNCLTRDGVRVDQNVCEVLRKEKLEEDAFQKRQAEYLEQTRLRQAERDAEKAERQAIIDEENRKRVAEMAREDAENKRYRDQIARDEAKEESVKKSKCGKDFMALRVGMTLDRFKECHEALAYVTETVGKDGTVETYRSTFYLIDAKGGRIVSYTKRRY